MGELIDSAQLYARALDDERLRSAGRLLQIRLVMGGVLVSLFLALGYVAKLPEARVAVPVVMMYLGLAAALMLAVRTRPSMKAASWYAVPFLDIPTAFVIQYRAVQVSATPDLGAGMTLAGFLVAIVAAQLSMQPRIIIATALMEMILEAIVCARPGQWHLWPFAVFLIGFGTALSLYVPRRVHALLQRVADEGTTRVRELEDRNREVRGLNEALRRQVADRSRELADALSRLTEAPRTPQRLAPGDVIEGRYRVVRVIGAGGMGQVHEVERLDDKRRFALKVLSGVADREGLIRFAREAQIAAEVDHPNVVAALDVGVSQSGMLFIVMELVSGSSLAEQSARYGDVVWAVPILRQVAEALAAMHARGIVHRDLKPSNVLLDGETVKVADFGIASLAGANAIDPTIEVDATVSLVDRPQLTRTGAFMGTPNYMAPELDKGAGQATSRADLFSLGVMAYELLAGRMPFSAPPVLERMQGREVAAPSPLAQLNPRLPVELAQLIDRCLAPAPEARPQAELVAAVLSAWQRPAWKSA